MPLLRQSRYPYLLFSFLFLIGHYLLCGQAPAVEWQRCYGGDDGDWANSIQQTSDGGHIVVGTSASGNTGDVIGHHGNGTVGDIWILKIDIHGNVEWQKSLGGSDSEDGASILQTADGGYIVAGSAASRNCDLTGNHGGFDFWVIKLNNKGDVIWQKMYGGSGGDYALSLSVTTDGGYFVAGLTSSNDGDVKGNHGSGDCWIIKIDGTGNLVWQKCLGGSGGDQATSIQSLADGGCIIAGVEDSKDGNVTNNHGIGDYWLVKLDKSGNIQWQKTYGGTGLDEAMCVRLTNDGGYIVAGYSGSYDGDVTGKRPPGSGDYDIWILKVDNAGNIQWKKCYGGANNDHGYFIQPTSDGGYVVAGSSSSANYDLTCNSGQYDAWIFKIDNVGDLQWQKSIGGNDYDEIRCVQPLNDGSFIVAGMTASSDIAGYHPRGPGTSDIGDYWVIKLTAPQSSSPAPAITFEPSSGIVCPNSSAAIKVETSFAGLNPTYQWTRNGIPVGADSPVYTASDFQNNDLITCTVISGGPSCNNSGLQTFQSLTIRTNNNIINPSIQITADNTFVCDCITNNFNATVNNGGTSPLYQWQINGQNTGVHSSVFSSNTLKLGDVITCVYSDNASCVAGGSVISNSIQLNNSVAGISVNVAASADTICAGTTVTFNANPVNAGANLVYQWTLNHTNVGNNSPTFSSNELSEGDQVNCIVTLSNVCSSVSVTSNTVAMTINSSPVINITPQDTVIHTGGQLQLTGMITGNVSSFQWTPADKLENRTELSPKTIPLTDNTTFTLTAVNNEGCTASKSILIKIFTTLYMPTAFTPNGDGKNDVFRIPAGATINLEEFSIYDRWGNKIFSTKNVSKGWNGIINGQPQATGVYVYIVKGTNEKGKIFLKGSFILIR
jgi:gliding motility-associated-like protein